jgi:hypothetical protein
MGEHRRKKSGAMSEDESRDLLETAVSVFKVLEKAAQEFCARHDRDDNNSVSVATVLMTEAVLFAVVVNRVDPEHHQTVLNNTFGGVASQLREWARNPEAFEHRHDA